MFSRYILILLNVWLSLDRVKIACINIFLLIVEREREREIYQIFRNSSMELLYIAIFMIGQDIDDAFQWNELKETEFMLDMNTGEHCLDSSWGTCIGIHISNDLRNCAA